MMSLKDGDGLFISKGVVHESIQSKFSDENIILVIVGPPPPQQKKTGGSSEKKSRTLPLKLNSEFIENLIDDVMKYAHSGSQGSRRLQQRSCCRDCYYCDSPPDCDCGCDCCGGCSAGVGGSNLVASIVVPLLVFIFCIIFIFCCVCHRYRRRRRLPPIFPFPMFFNSARAQPAVVVVPQGQNYPVGPNYPPQRQNYPGQGIPGAPQGPNYPPAYPAYPTSPMPGPGMGQPGVGYPEQPTPGSGGGGYPPAPMPGASGPFSNRDGDREESGGGMNKAQIGQRWPGPS